MNVPCQTLLYPLDTPPVPYFFHTIPIGHSIYTFIPSNNEPNSPIS
jgi:hypothetical protein